MYCFQCKHVILSSRGKEDEDCSECALQYPIVEPTSLFGDYRYRMRGWKCENVMFPGECTVRICEDTLDCYECGELLLDHRSYYDIYHELLLAMDHLFNYGEEFNALHWVNTFPGHLALLCEHDEALKKALPKHLDFPPVLNDIIIDYVCANRICTL